MEEGGKGRERVNMMRRKKENDIEVNIMVDV